MTNLKAIQSKAILNYPIDEDTYLLVLTDADVNPTEVYVKENKRAIELCVADLILTLISSATSIQDDGYAVKLADVPALWKLRAHYRRCWGLPDDTPNDKPIITNLTNQW